MQQGILPAVAIVLFQLGGVYGQAQPSNGFNQFLSGALGAVTGVNSAKSAEAAQASKTSSSASSTSSSTSSTPTSSQPSSTQPTSSPSATSAPAAGGLSTHSRNLIIILAVVFGVLLIALILLAILCLRKRSKRRKGRSATPLAEDEFDTWRKTEPGREYSSLHPPGAAPSLQQQPTVPVMTTAPQMQQHPARRPENPFVPIPPIPRRVVAPNSHSGLTDAAVMGDEPFVTPIRTQGQGMRRSPNSVSPARTPYTPTSVDPFVTPVRPAGHRMRNSTDDSLGSLYHPNMTQPRRHSQGLQIQTPVSAARAPSPRRSSNILVPVSAARAPSPRRSSNIPAGATAAIGNPYQDMHVHVLQTDEPSMELRQSLHNRETLHRRSQTPPTVPSRSPRRTRFADSAHSSESSGSGSGTNTNEEFRSTQTSPVQNPAPPTAPWNDRDRRYYSTSPVRQPMPAAAAAAAGAPWTHHERHPSGSPRQPTSAAPWSHRDRPTTYSNSPITPPASSSAPWTTQHHDRDRNRSSNGHAYAPVTPPPPPPPSAPWLEHNEAPRRSSMTPRHSAQNTPRHSAPNTPRQSMSGPPRRLRFSDVQDQQQQLQQERPPQWGAGVGEAL